MADTEADFPQARHHARLAWQQSPAWLRSIVKFVLAPGAVAAAAWLQGLPPLGITGLAVATSFIGVLVVTWAGWFQASEAAERAQETYWKTTQPQTDPQELLRAAESRRFPTLRVTPSSGTQAALEIRHADGSSGRFRVRAKVTSWGLAAEPEIHALYDVDSFDLKAGDVHVVRLAALSSDRDDTWVGPNRWATRSLAETGIELYYEISWDRGEDVQTIVCGKCFLRSRETGHYPSRQARLTFERVPADPWPPDEND